MHIILCSLLIIVNIGLSLCSRPVITEHPSDVRVHRGAPATLNCGAFGAPAPTISWFKDGERVFTGGGDHTVLLPGGNLFFLRTLHNHRTRDSGVYTCRAENEEGVVYSHSATLTVTYLKHEFGHVPKLLSAESGESIGLSCFPPEGNPKPTISWTRQGRELDMSSGKYSLDPSGVLLVNRLEPEDSGKYECSVANEVGSRSDSPVTLKVSPPGGSSSRPAAEPEAYLPAPVITEGILLDRVTGLVHWLPVRGCTGYVVRVSVAGVEITNISVEESVTQVKLHSLDPAVVYAVSMAAVKGTAVSEFSNVVELSRGEVKEVTVHMTEPDSEEIPANVWVVGMIIVVLVTILIIISAVVIFHRISVLREKDSERSVVEVEAAAEKAGGRRYSWIDRRWAENPVSSFKSDRLLVADNTYDYVMHRAYDKSSEAYQIPVHKLEAEIYHYASAPIIKKESAESSAPILKEYLMPIQPKKI